MINVKFKCRITIYIQFDHLRKNCSVVHRWKLTTHVICTICKIQVNAIMCQSRGNHVIISHRYLQKVYVFVATPCQSVRICRHTMHGSSTLHTFCIVKCYICTISRNIFNKFEINFQCKTKARGAPQCCCTLYLNLILALLTENLHKYLFPYFPIYFTIRIDVEVTFHTIGSLQFKNILMNFCIL